jgi:hypothetical protein
LRPVSAAFLATIRGSHTATVRARVVETFQTGTNPTGTEVSVVGGSARIDGTADIRSTADLTVDGTGMWPARVDDLLAPYGNEIYIERGVAYGNGTTEWCSLGYFRIQAPEQNRPEQGPIRIEARDRMAGIIDGRLLEPRQFEAAATYGDVVTALITEVYPAATIQWDDGSDLDPLGRQVICEEDRHGFLKELVTGLGKIWHWDHRGILVIQDPPDPTAPVWDVTAGAGGVLVEASRALTRERVYNAVVALGEATDTETPSRGVAFDDNPESPTYFAGRFGPVPRFYASPFLTTDTQATTAAAAILRQQLGLPYNVDLAAIPNPALEPADPVRVRFSASGSVETHIIQSVTIPLAVEAAMSATTREQTVVLIGTA